MLKTNNFIMAHFVDYSQFLQVYLINWNPLHESICHNKCVISNSPISPKERKFN